MKSNRFLQVVLLLVASVCGSAQAVMLDMEGETSVKVTSSYLWRGEVVSDDTCIQPSVTISGAGASLNMWGTWEWEDTSNATDRSRVDITLDYTWSSGPIILRVGTVAYILHDGAGGGGQDTFEAFIDYVLDVPLLPSFTVNYDYGEIEGFYVSASLAHSLELWKEAAALDLRVDVGGADENYNNAIFNFPATDETEAYTPNKSGLVDLTIKASLPINIGENFAVIPEVKYMSLLDSEIKDAARAAGRDDSETAYSLTFSAFF